MSLSEQSLYRFGDFVLDTSERQLRRGEETISMPLKAIETLCLLVENHGKLMSKDMLMNELWADTFVEDRNLAQNIFTLRKKLGEDKNGTKFIETVPKLGYRFVALVSHIESDMKETLELSLEQKTTITAEGNLSKEDLAEAIRASAVDIDGQDQQVKRIGGAPGSGSLSLVSPAVFLVISALSILTIGVGFWLWNNSDSSKIRTAKFDTAKVQLERITNSGQAWHPAVSPNGKYIAYISQSGENTDGIQLQNIATGSVKEVINAANAEFGSPIFGKNGDYIFYTTHDGERATSLYKVPILGGSKQRIATNVLSDASISPDGKWLAFIRAEDFSKGRELIICRADGSKQRILKKRSEPEGYLVWGISPSWSPDGKKLIAAAYKRAEKKGENDEQYIVEVDIETGAETLIKTPKFHGLSQPRHMPDGKSLIVLAKETANSPMQVWQISYPEGIGKRITNDLFDYSRLNVSPDGTYLLTNERTNTSNLFLVDSTSGKVTDKLTETSAMRNGSDGLTWAPDGKRIVYSRLNGKVGNLWSYDLETKNNRQITFDEKVYSVDPGVTPDGKSIIFASNRSSSRQVWRMNFDGSNLEQLTDGAAIRLPEISPDGEWLFYHQSGVLWKKSLSGGKPIKFLKGGDRTRFTSDSKTVLVYYFDAAEKENSPWKYVIMPVDGSGEHLETKIPSTMGIDWNGSDTEIYFGERRRTKSNILAYSVAKKTSRRLTNFDDLQIDFLKVSPDGKKIAIARGQSKSEVIKISGFN